MIDYLVLGVVQGLTEFLPVSSSGHLVLAERLLGFNPPGVLLEACLHLGTAAAVVVLFWRDLVAMARSLSRRGTLERRKEIGFLLVATVPIGVAGFLLRGVADTLFSSLRGVGAGWIVVGALLLFVDRVRSARRQEWTFLDAAVVGLAQAVSVLPGVSRSGVTIAAGILRGVEPAKAARFAFLLSIPALVAAGLLQLAEAVRSGFSPAPDGLGVLLGTAVAFVVGLAAIRALLAAVSRGRLWIFGAYSLALGVAVLASGLR